MNRTYKFRGKSNSGKWVYGSLVWTEGQQPEIYFPIFFTDNPKKILGWDWAYVDEKTVGQLTCKDYNDNDIYDGDIIEGESGIRHLIQFNEEEARFEAVLLPLNPWNNNGALRQSWIQEFKKRVIGNKFDNPEMVTSEY